MAINLAELQVNQPPIFGWIFREKLRIIVLNSYPNCIKKRLKTNCHLEYIPKQPKHYQLSQTATQNCFERKDLLLNKK